VLCRRYPPVEILIVDDGSPERCSDAARSLLLGNVIAAPRKRQVQTLAKWWGWGAAELAYFHDEVLLTPNRGVAHARNAGIRRARGDWIVCLDGDDTISDMYFLKAMERVSAVPRTNLVYANQQFFGESRWQWTVPPLRPDSALVNGPLPLMSIWRRDLWFGTPHGFDEALPKGHEDWAFWLQLMRLPLVHFKIDEFLTQYRYKKNSKMRNREHNNPEIPRLMRCLFPDLYPVSWPVGRLFSPAPGPPGSGIVAPAPTK
jgi:glycosyltransferase involved in cell wall biosynthesis